MKNYIVGYGSLINKASRQSSSPSAKEIIPVKVYGFTRGWFARTGVAGFSTTYVGCLKNNSPYLSSKDKKEYLNGVMYEVDENELPILDIRERRYVRRLVNHDSILGYDRNIPNDCKIWIYENDFESVEEFNDSFPDENFPIIQSYVDMCLEGCIEVENSQDWDESQNFSLEFINLTIGWNEFYANDRVYPRRPQSFCKNAYRIDDLLNDSLPPNIFDNIYIE